MALPCPIQAELAPKSTGSAQAMFREPSQHASSLLAVADSVALQF